MFKKLLVSKLVPVLLSVLSAVAVPAAHAAEPLTLKVYNADAGSFHVNSVLVSGETEAVVIDAGFTRADAHRIAANVLDSGKTLTTIYVSQADPDFYFGVEVLKRIFPKVVVLTSSAVLEKIEAKLPAKVAFWGPKMGVNAPQNPVLPTLFEGDKLLVDGQALELHGLTGELAHRPYIWIPSLHAVVGSVAVFGDLHVWTADVQKNSARKAWIAQLDEMESMDPAIVVPGHMKAGTSLDVNTIRYTRNYLQRFYKMADSAKSSAELIDGMKAAYPDAGLGIALDIGSKVATGEMAW
ncbi:MBL fold metallo-hydrolase [Neptunomonas antarctica]|uniref:Glyoxylase, beta-lactamase superfamily II n=1 Tax=Neptunomonas antarctica TaxID=619304 RepID=A0A1N7NWD9_9GAMM|nr:MBL fold metallo-hydrolase [Neptunomonas antarctica]SIT02612.1 Glyoxylase, beta-lactamase superfamily II [Neptunomonas antarctica]